MTWVFIIVINIISQMHPRAVIFIGSVGLIAIIGYKLVVVFLTVCSFVTFWNTFDEGSNSRCPRCIGREIPSRSLCICWLERMSHQENGNENNLKCLSDISLGWTTMIQRKLTHRRRIARKGSCCICCQGSAYRKPTKPDSYLWNSG